MSEPGTIFLLSVGTSLFEPKWGIAHGQIPFARSTYPVRTTPDEAALAAALEKPWPDEIPEIAAFLEPLGALDPDLAARIRESGNFGPGDPFPAEISSLALSRRDPIWQEPVRLGFLASDTNKGTFCARSVRHLARRLFPGIEVIATHGDERQGFLDGVHRVPQLLMTDPRQFLEVALPAVAEAVMAVQRKYPGVPVVLDVSGGFKGLIPFSGVLGAVLDGVTVQSVFEFSTSHVRQPPLPVRLDAVMWSEHRAALAAIEDTREERPETALAFWEALPERLRGLWLRQPDGRLLRSPLAAAVRTRTEELLASGAVAQHQHPEFLKALFEDKGKANALLAWFAKARNIWLGDLIPETVDHGRGHAQRLCELAYQVLKPIREKSADVVSDDEALALLATLWVHDVGHASHRLQLSTPSFWGDGTDQRRPVERDISAFPSLVRDFHSFTACERLQADDSFQFPPDLEVLGKPLRETVALGYRFHRSKLSLAGRKRSQMGATLKGGVQVCWGWLPHVEKGIGALWGPHTPLVGQSPELVTALQRVIDGADVQTERAGDRATRECRQRLTRDELRVELERLVRLRVTVPHLWRHDWTTLDGAHFGLLWRDYLSMEIAVGEPGANDVVVELDGTRWLLAEPTKERERHMSTLEAAIYRCLEVLWALPELDAGEAAFLEYLSAFDRVVFKYPQVLHFEKHAHVLSSAFRPTEDFKKGHYEFDVVLECAAEATEEGARFIAREIASEASVEVQEVLRTRGISIRKVEARRHGQTLAVESVPD